MLGVSYEYSKRSKAARETRMRQGPRTHTHTQGAEPTDRVTGIQMAFRRQYANI